MKIGLLSDVHANKPALNAVLEDMPPVDKVVHAGDVVGYGPYPEDVIDIFQAYDITSIQGNHDRAVLGDFHDNFHEIPKAAALWTADQLDADKKAYLESLPLERDLCGGRVHLAHGQPGKPNTYTYPEDFTSNLLTDESILVLGHTHLQAKSCFEDGTVVNPGSVGLPRDGDWRAAYAVLDVDNGTVDLQRVKYPKEQTKARLEEHDLPQVLKEALDQGELSFGRAKRSVDDAVE